LPTQAKRAFDNLAGAGERVLILVRRGLRTGLPAQLFQAVSQFFAAFLAGPTVLTVWPVDSQKGQHVAEPKSKALNERGPFGVWFRWTSFL